MSQCAAKLYARSILPIFSNLLTKDSEIAYNMGKIYA